MRVGVGSREWWVTGRLQRGLLGGDSRKSGLRPIIWVVYKLVYLDVVSVQVGGCRVESVVFVEFPENSKPSDKLPRTTT